jgi:hypothetical protein
VNESSEGRFITFACECGQKLKVPAEQAGAKGRCRACGRNLVVPASEQDGPPLDDELYAPSSDYVSPVHTRNI